MTKDAPKENEAAEIPQNAQTPPPQPEAEADTTTTSEIVENLTIPISIELSRTRMSIAELGALKNGQIVELNKSPGDLVDLVVSGKVIGKGELVEIEGELGVRISSLVK